MIIVHEKRVKLKDRSRDVAVGNELSRRREMRQKFKDGRDE